MPNRRHPVHLALQLAVVFLMACPLCPGSDQRVLPLGRDVLHAVILNLPSEPLVTEGELLIRKKRGNIASRFGFSMELRWGESPSRATYTFADAFGNPLEQMSVSRTETGRPTVSFRSGKELTLAPPPPLNGRILGSGVTWTDLLLDFLWWPDATVKGVENFKNRDCYVVEIKPGANADTTPEAYATVTAWIDVNAPMLLKAEARDAQGHMVRKLWVRSVRKIKERWMLKDLEVQEADSKTRTSLVVRDLAGEEADD